MHTLQSRRGPFSRSNTPSHYARRSASRDAARIAGPAPAYPSTAPLHDDWLGGRINGHTVILRLMRDPPHVHAMAQALIGQLAQPFPREEIDIDAVRTIAAFLVYFTTPCQRVTERGC